VPCFRNNDTTSITIEFNLSDKMGSDPLATDTMMRRTLTVDGKPPAPYNGTLDALFSYDFLTRVLTVTVTSPVSELDTIRLSRTDSTRLDSVIAVTAGATVLTIGSVDRIFMSFEDRFGNAYDTAWSYSIGIPPGGQPMLPGVYAYDFGRLKLTVGGVALSAPVQQRMFVQGLDTVSFYTDKYPLQPATRTALLSGGFAYVAQEGYWFMVEYPRADSFNIWDQGITIEMRMDTANPSLNEQAACVYRLNRVTGEVTLVGGIYNGAAFMVLENQTFSPVMNAAFAASSDTFFYFIGVDTSRVRIDRLTSALTYDSASQSVRLRLIASDNTKSVSARVRLAGYGASGAAVDLMNFSANLFSSVNLDTSVSLPQGREQELLKGGVFAAVWATDQVGSDRARREYHYMRCAAVFDTVKMAFRELTEKYQLVSVPYTLPPEDRDALYVMRDLSQGRYDRNVLRLYKVDPASRAAVKEFMPGGTGKAASDADTAFKFEAGNAFFLMTHYYEDNLLPVSLSGAATLPVNIPDKGYLVLSGAAEGWYLGAAPFLGNVRVSSIDRVSVRAAGSMEFFRRLFVDPASNWTTVGGDVLPAADHGKGFAVYLYPGDSLIMPVMEDADLLNDLPRAASTDLFRVTARLKAASGDVLDGYNEMSVSADAADFLPDLPLMNSRGMELSIVRGKKQLCLDRVRDDGLGKIWTLVLRNGNNRKDCADYTLEFNGLAGLPGGWEAWVDDRERGYGTDLIREGGTYGLSSAGGTSKTLRFITGPKAFIKKHVAQTVPLSFCLGQNYPNPFNPVTTLSFNVPDFTRGRQIAGTRVTLTLYNVRGQEIRRLKDGVALPGYHRVHWDGRDSRGRAVSTGIYLCRISVKNPDGREVFLKTRKMIMAK
jgi:hypothetical protein